MAKERKLGRPADQRKALLRNQVSQLIWNGKITTTLDRAKEVRSILLSDLSQNHTARELAERFQIGETSLKNYFRGVFGENLSVWLREARMRRAAELLRDTELRVAEIAEQVGYENQSKFAAVFAKQFGCPPLEYRRRARLD